MNSPARLVVQIGAQPQRIYPIERDITIIGRETINDLVVNDAEVSRRHTRVTRQPEGYLVDDLGSTNGTFVNGKRVTVPTLLYHGDVIDMGKSVHLIFELEQPYEQVTKPIQMEPDPPYQPEPPAYEPNPGYQQQVPAMPAPPMPEPERSPYAPPAAAPSRPQFEDTPPPQPATPIYEEAFQEYEEADSAEFYRPPAAPIMVDGERAPEAEEESGGCQRYFVTCGCLSLLFIVLLLSALFILDNVAPEALYCGPIQGLWETLLGPILRATGRVWVCPA